MSEPQVENVVVPAEPVAQVNPLSVSSAEILPPQPVEGDIQENKPAEPSGELPKAEDQQPIQPPQEAIGLFGDDPYNGDGEPVENPDAPLTEDQKYQANVRNNWRNFTDDELADAMVNPLGAQELLKLISSMSETHLKVICPFLTTEHINKVMPQLQLQNQGMLVQELNSEQVKVCVAAISQGDRQLLLQNITLITQSELRASRNEEIQSIIGFIDPLAMAVAVERPELASKVLSATSIMTTEQIRVIVPLLTAEQLRLCIETIESDENHVMAVSMVNEAQKAEVIQQLKTELPELTEKLEKNFSPQVQSLQDADLPELTRDVEQFVSIKEATATTESEFKALSDKLTKTKQTIEQLQRDARQCTIKMKVPQKLLNPEGDNKELHEEYTKQADEFAKLSKQLHQLFSVIDKGNLQDGLLHALTGKYASMHDQLKRPEPQNRTEVVEDCEEDTVFMDCDLSVILYEAVKSIGNPQTIGDIYKISWTDIVKHGFRSADDFKKQNVTSLQELETYIENKKNPPAEATQPSANNAEVQPAEVPQVQPEVQPQPAQ